MITISFNGTDEAFADHVAGTGAELEELIRAHIDAANTELQRVIVNEKLAGEVLQRRTGELADTVHVIAAEQDGDTMTGYIAAGGAAAPYAKYQEEGTSEWYDILPVNKAALAFFPGGSEGAGLPAQIAQALTGKEFRAAGGVLAKKVHHPPIEQRSFLGSALDERRPAMVADLEAAIAEALHR